MKKEEHFRKIVDDNSDRIMRICRYYNPNEDDQKDMYQEVLVNVWKSLDTFRGDAKISTWIYRIAVNTSLSYIGKGYKQMTVSSDWDNIGELLDDDGEEKELLEEQFDLLQVRLNQLSVIDKILISLVMEGLSTKEIAHVIGLTEPNVRVKIHRVKEQLRKQIVNNQ